MSADLYPIGTVFRRSPLRVSVGGHGAISLSNTQAVRPENSTTSDTEFIGVTVRDGERVSEVGGQLTVQRTGDILARVMGPVKVGDTLGMVAGQPCLSSKYYGSPVGRCLQEVTGAGEKLIRVRTTSAAPPAETGTEPFQILRVSESTAKVNTGFLLQGFDAKDKARIWGLNSEFTVKQDHVIYLELVFDVNLAPVLASACSAPSWDPDTFPRLIKSVRKSENAAQITQLNAEFSAATGGALKHVGISPSQNTANLATAATALQAFANASGNVRCFKSFMVIGYATTGQGAAGPVFIDNGTPFTVVQCLKHNLMLAGFCDNGTPALCPIPYAGPILECLPAVVASTFSDGITLAVPGHPDATIFYTLDGSDPIASSTPYTGKIGWQPTGTWLKSHAAEDGWYGSPITTTQAWT